MTLRKFIFVNLIFLALPTTLALAHGEDKPGPHGGHLRMPGAFHTELVSKGDETLSVYLLDVQFKNPDVKSSTLTVTAKTNGTEMELACEAQSDKFLCKLPKTEGKPVKIERLVVKAKYKNIPAGVATYKLPLKFADSAH